MGKAKLMQIAAAKMRYLIAQVANANVQTLGQSAPTTNLLLWLIAVAASAIQAKRLAPHIKRHAQPMGTRLVVVSATARLPKQIADHGKNQT